MLDPRKLMNATLALLLLEAFMALALTILGLSLVACGLWGISR